MPRPKRTRVASTRTAPQSLRPEPIANVNSGLDSDAIADSDHENREEGQDVQTKRVTRTSVGAARRSYSLQQSKQRRDSAMSRLEMEDVTTSATGNPAEEASDSSVELGRRGNSTPKHGGLAEMSGLDMDDSMFRDLDTSFDETNYGSAQRSNNTSTLSASNFKRRPRQGSFLSRDDGPIRPSSRAGPNTPGISSTFNIGNFRRRAREPSILGTAQKERAPRPTSPEEESDEEAPALESESEEEAVAPQAESTPLHKKGTVSSSPESSPIATPDTNSRKRKSTAAHERRTRSTPQVDSEQVVEDNMRSSVESPLSSPPQLVSRPTTPVADYDEDDVMAPPLSSGSSAGDAEIWPPLQSLARRRRAPQSVLRRTPVRGDNESDMSSPPSLTHSPNYDEPTPPPKQAPRTTRRAAKQETRVTTADLTGMLPRRRHRHVRDPFGIGDSDEEVDTTGLGNSDDELSYLDVRARRRPARPQSRAGVSGSRAQSRARPGSSAANKGKGPASAKPLRRTYGRNNSDKENQDDDEEGAEYEEGHSLAPLPNDGPSENSEELAERVGDELKNATKKFKEVDKWELEYEEMTQSSSPRDGR